MKKDLLKKMYDEHLPKMNPNIMKGINRQWMDNAPHYIDQHIRNLMKNTTPDLEYIGFRMMTPEEQHKKMVTNAGELDISKNNLALWEFEFLFQGQPIDYNFNIFLLYLDQGDKAYLSNTLYHFMPILSTGIITPYPNRIFILISKDKFFMERFLYTVDVDGIDYPLDINYSNGLNKKLGRDKPIITPILMYPLAKLGLKGFVDRYLEGKHFEIIDLTEPFEYDKEKYSLIKSVPALPPRFKGQYEKHNLGILVEKNDRLSLLLATTLIYLFDYTPTIARQLKDIYGEVKETEYYQTALIKLMFHGVSVDLTTMDTKLRITLSNYDIYMDDWVKSKLDSVNFSADTFYDFLVKCSLAYNDLTTNSQKYMSDINNRHLDILYNIHYDILENINMLFLILNNNYMQDSGNGLTLPVVKKHFRPTNGKGSVSRNLIKQIIGGRNGSALALEVVNKSNDDLFSGLTGNIQLRERGDGTKKATKRKSGKNGIVVINPTDPMVGSAVALSKSYTSPLLTINPFVNIDLHTGKFLLTERDLETVEMLKTMFEEKIEEDVLQDVVDVINDMEEPLDLDLEKSLED